MNTSYCNRKGAYRALDILKEMLDECRKKGEYVGFLANSAADSGMEDFEMGPDEIFEFILLNYTIIKQGYDKTERDHRGSKQDHHHYKIYSDHYSTEIFIKLVVPSGCPEDTDVWVTSFKDNKR